MDLRRQVELAAERIRPYVRRTPVERSPVLAAAAGGDVWLKLENQQITGSFKLRGAINKLLSLAPAVRARGVVAASSGNHGLAVAHGAAVLGCPARIFVPDAASPAKVEAIRALGVEVRSEPGDPLRAEEAARRDAAARGATYVSPYNDPQVVAGQGTIGRELARQIDEPAAVYVALGGGGLAAGIGGYLRAVAPAIEIVACSPERSPVMARSLAAGEILDLPSRPTLSDGTAGGVEPGAITFELCRRAVDRCLEVTEEEIAAAMRLVIGRCHQLIEGAAGVAVAGFLADPKRPSGRAAIVLCGANAGLDALRRVLCD